MNEILALMAGIGLSAAAGFRVFLPLLVLSMAAHNGMLELSDGFAWLGSTPALLLLGTATVVEIIAYFLPWVDNLLDTIATPLAVMAGTLATASVLGDVDPAVRWGLALVAGGGVAGTVQLGTVLTRGASTATTGGTANPAISTAEGIGSAATATLAIYLPVVVFILVCALLVWTVRKLRNRRQEPDFPRQDG